MNFKLKLRKVIAIAICLAAVTMWSGCDEDPADDKDGKGTEEPGGTDNPGGTGDNTDNSLYCIQDHALSISLRNVHLKYSIQNPLYNSCNQIVQAEAMACEGYLYARGMHYDATDFCKEGFNHHHITINEPPLYKRYSLDDIEWFQNDASTCYPTLDDAASLYLGYKQNVALSQYYYDRKEKFWDSPEIEEHPGIAGMAGGLRSSGNFTTTWREEEESKTIAGIQCEGYAVRKKETYNGEDRNERLLYKVWYDSKTSVTMRYEGYTVYNELTYWFEINEIEYGNIKKEDIQNILDEWLKNNDPKDVSDSDEPGSWW
ncbi:MAG: hypothetical protein LBR52_01225 [Prevotellaceae bacterium]|jgi:hypothetical protein|nr:hypothetical protein [Prevotellaceae bacterium]